MVQRIEKVFDRQVGEGPTDQARKQGGKFLSQQKIIKILIKKGGEIMSKIQLEYFLARRVLFCAYHKIKTLREFLALTNGVSEK